MFPLLLVVAGVGMTIDVETWAGGVCPPVNAVSKAGERLAIEVRATCLQKAAEQEAETVAAAYAEDLASTRRLRATTRDWAALTDATCKVTEDAAWVVLQTGVRTKGAGKGMAKATCRQRMFAFRGAFLSRLAEGGATAGDFLRATARVGAIARERFFADRATLAQRVAAPPVRPAGLAKEVGFVGKWDWANLATKYKEVADTLARIAATQCVIPGHGLVDDCEGTVERALWSVVDVHWAESGPPPDADPPADAAPPAAK